MKVIQIGNGNAAKMHRACFAECGTKVTAVIDTDPIKRKRAEEEGFPAFPDVDSVPLLIMDEVDFWDVCVPDESHFPMMEKLLEMDVRKILVEKPLCQPSQIKAVKKLLEKFPEAQICVGEHYASSLVVEITRNESEKCGIRHPRIWIEQSKNRMQDIINGRFIDKELGVFALEVPHSLTVVAATGKNRRPEKILSVSLESMELPSGEILLRQGWGAISYFTEDGCEVEICSAMNGKIIHPLPEIDAPTVIPFGSPTRYRVLVLEEGKNKIIGQFEPIPGWPRFVGQVLVYKDGILTDRVQVEDKPMNRHIAKAIRYFAGEEKNPGPPSEALAIVKFLKEVLAKLGP